MKIVSIAFALLCLASGLVHAAEEMDADSVKNLITGNTVHAVNAEGVAQKNYFAPDGKTYRQIDGKTLEGTWHVKEDGSQCVDGMPGGCARIVKNDDGTYDRIVGGNKVRLKWRTVVQGRDF